MPPSDGSAGDIADGPTRIQVKTSALNTGSSPSAKGKQRLSTCWATPYPFTAVPFFWSQHYDVPINYVGHTESWDEIVTEGDIMSQDCLLRFMRNGHVRAITSIFRDLESLEAEVVMERATAA